MAVAAKPVKDNRVIKYGRVWPNKPWGPKGKVIPCPDWYIELCILRDYERMKSLPGNKLVSWPQHFVNFTKILFGDPRGIYYFEWNPNAMRILGNFYKHNILAIAGHKSSSKTNTLAMIGAMWFFIFPKDTKVIVTSTTVAAAKDKIWGQIKLIWIHLEKYFGPNVMPGKLIDSQNRIRYEHNGIKNEMRGIILLAAESSSEKDSADKLQGTKAEQMIVMGDEFATLKHSLVNTALNNLTANKKFKLAGAFNPSSYYDPGGIISRPKGGWATITEDDDEWETEIEPFGLKGYCIRFDGEKSPNVVLGEERWKGLLTLEKLQQIGPIGTKTKGYYEQIRGFWSPAGDLDSIYTETEIVKYGADRPCTTWVEPPTIVAALDPGFVHGGDRAALAIGKSGIAVNVDTQTKQKVFELTHLYVLDEDITNKSISKTEWVVQLTKEKLQEHKVDVRNFAIDATGGGEPFGALIARECGLGFINIKFSGKGSDMPVSRNDSRKGSERFFNMASELWYVGRELVRTGQIKGLKPDVVAELVSRTYQERAGVVQIESKKDMRLRTKKSPDCFVAGTLVKTPSGDRPIENLRVGDFVETPFGASRIIFTHKTTTKNLTKVQTLDGNQLIGKGAHKVYTSSFGWKRLDELCKDIILESDKNQPIWQILISLFTRVENTDFKHLENIIKTRTGVGRVQKRDYFIELSGLSTMAIFQKVFASITKMAIGQTIPSKILNSWKRPITLGCTFVKGCLAPFFKKKPTGVSPKQGMPQNSGTNQKKGGSGTQNMQERLLKTCHLSQEFVFNAESNSHQSKNQISALTHVGKKITTEKIELRKLVIAAARYLKLLLFRDRCNAVKNVQQLSLGESVEVYNLTLDRENVYYANGILVQNCADAAVMALHVARVRHGLSSNEKAAVVLRHTKNPDFSLDFLTKKPSQSSFPENRLITFGGGWAKQI